MTHFTNEQLIDYMHGALAPQDDAAAYEHIAHCPACRSAYDAELALTDLLRADAEHGERELPSALKAEIWNRIRAAQPSPWDRLALLLRPALALPLAAVIAIGAYFGVSSIGPRSAPSIAASYYLQDHAALNSTVPFNDRNPSPVGLEQAAVFNSRQSGMNVQSAASMADATQ